MQSDLCARYDLASLAAETGYSKSHFLRAFQASTGTTPHQYIIQLRLEAARRLLRSRSSTMFEIALKCGFANDAHFSRVFRQNFGVSPHQYRTSA
jgi:AraC family transcriptional regulator